MSPKTPVQTPPEGQESAAPTPAPPAPRPWIWGPTVLVLAAGSALWVHGVFRALSLAASAAALYALFRRRRGRGGPPPPRLW